ncbi:MAG: cell-cell signaling protein [Deltaproteobacteria bacterium]|nr:cell-cell signaling protein [Deltaproteobacteria bacterium]
MQLKSIEKAIIIGAGHGIGFALFKQLQALAPQAELVATYRDPAKAAPLLEQVEATRIRKVDPTQESDLEALSEGTDSLPGKLHLLINTTGWLHQEQYQPEKSLRQINAEQMLEYFKVNSVTAALLGKYFLRQFRHKEDSCFASISAKVGSIEDNRIGGWYGYRSSKAALNMIKRTMAIEFKRSGCRCNLLAIHPGTTVTELSKPYIKNTQLKLHSPDETALNILRIIEDQPFEPEAQFMSWDGQTLPW